jgi:hypothetical protein
LRPPHVVVHGAPSHVEGREHVPVSVQLPAEVAHDAPTSTHTVVFDVEGRAQQPELHRLPAQQGAQDPPHGAQVDVVAPAGT